MHGKANPGYDYTLTLHTSTLPQAIEAAPELIREAYYRMKTPPEYELYDLQAIHTNFAIWRHRRNTPRRLLN